MKKLLKMKRTLESVSQADPQTKGDSELDTGAADPPRTIFSDSDIAELRLQLRMHESCKFVSGDLMNRDSHGHWNGHVTATSHPGSHYAASVIIAGVSEMVHVDFDFNRHEDLISFQRSLCLTSVATIVFQLPLVQSNARCRPAILKGFWCCTVTTKLPVHCETLPSSWRKRKQITCQKPNAIQTFTTSLSSMVDNVV